MNFWVKVISTPLGFAAFALYLLFGVIKGRTKKPKWLLPTVVILAGAAIISGVLLQYGSSGGAEPKRPSVQQDTKGDQSPAINTGSGDVTITYGEKPTPAKGRKH